MKKQPTSSNSRPTILTQHVMLVVWGLFAQKIGLIKQLEAVPIKQKVRQHTPQKKVMEFFVAMLAGLSHLQDLSRAAHPIDQDEAVAEAWGQSDWADYSGVSRTLAQLRESEVDEIGCVLKEIERPYIEQEVELSLGTNGYLLFDGDLTGRPVSNSSTTYPKAAFGYMGDTISLGYQAAMVTLDSPTFSRLWLSSTLHPGDTVSANEARALVLAGEKRVERRPRRRTELLAQRLAELKGVHETIHQKMDESYEKLREAQERLEETQTQYQSYEQEVTLLERTYENEKREPTAHCRLSRAKRKAETFKKRLPRCQRELEKAQRRYKRAISKFDASQAELEDLNARLHQLEADNASNPNPIRAIFRLDAGFASVENIVWLIEMGYEVFTKARSTVVRDQLLRWIDSQAVEWQRVGKNASMIAWANSEIEGYLPYPVDLALVRYHTGETLRHSVLLHYGDEPLNDDLEQWFHTYNGRQTIEAGIKEGKNVFQMHHFKVRAVEALRLQESLAIFAANFVRFAAYWLRSHPQQETIETQSVKKMVQIGAHTSAWVSRNKDVWLLTFTEQSIYAGRSLRFGKGHIQLPLFRNIRFCHF